MQRISDVLARLDGIIDQCLAERSRLGYFASLYRQMTLAVKHGIEEGRFEDGARMERLDVLFAQRYFDAYDAYRKGGRPTASWFTAFDSARSWRLLIIQHLLLGINAHINLDLGIAAAQTAPGSGLPSLERDFQEINRIIAELTGQVEQEIDSLSPWFALLNKVGGRTDSAIVNFSIGIARHEAWELARELAPLSPAEQAPVIERRDKTVAGIARRIASPGTIVNAAGLIIRTAERAPAPRVIRVLSERIGPGAPSTPGLQSAASRLP